MSFTDINLLNASKPLRYTGGEPGAIIKRPDGKLRFCLIFPDAYEIGMSHLGYKILYTNLNRSQSIYCERFFAPWPDAWEAFGKDIMVSLETHHPVAEFDAVGFSFQYEMAYITALQLLTRSGISLKSADRGEKEPLVFAGGCCILNPAPLSEFIDVFFIGEMDEALVPVMEELHTLRQNGASRCEQLEMLNAYPFTYVPSLDPNKKAKREIFKGFSQSDGRTAPFVPLMPAVQDRVVCEISRGCTNGCRFCQAGMIYRPVREKSVADLCKHTVEMVEATGYQEASLLSLDSGDYTQIEPLLDRLSGILNSKRISLNLPSLRAETVNPQLLDKLGAVRKGGFTIAPEAGTQRMRDIINKNLSEDEILSAAVYARNAGYNGAKLYFMCGLPYETDEDILGIAELVKKIRLETRKATSEKAGRFFDLTVSLSNFVPKPHTPFERFGQNNAEELRRKHNLLRDALKKEKVKIRCHDPVTSTIEAAIARGDSSLAKIFEQAVTDGFYLDAWSEHFDRHRWVALFEACGSPIETYSTKTYSADDTLPWGMVDCGIDEKWMEREVKRAENAETTPDCRKGNCSVCGVCDFKEIKNTDALREPLSLEKLPSQDSPNRPHGRYELIFKREGVAVMMSALDTVRIFNHLLLANGALLKFTEGFNPQPRMVLQAPLPVGVGGEAESLLFEAYELPKGIENQMNQSGITVLSIKEAVWPKNLSDYTMVFGFDRASFSFLAEALRSQNATYQKLDKKGRVKILDLKDYLIGVDEDKKTVEVTVTNKGGFHFPEFFRKAGFEGLPRITRLSLKPMAFAP